MKKDVLLIGIILMILLFSAQKAIGVSVSPSKVKMSFEPNTEYEGVTLIGTGGNTYHMAITTWGDFEIKLEKSDIYCDIEPCEVRYTVVLPESFETPGTKRGYIVVSEAYDEDPQGLMFVKVAMTMPIYVEVPYPGKYLEWVSLEAENVAEGDSSKIIGKLMSKGEETVNEASGYILIYDYNGNLVGSSGTNKVKNIINEQPVMLAALWDSGINKQGNYRADMKVVYDGLQTNNSINFKLGGLNVSMINYSDLVYLGGIKQFFVTVDSIWSEEISNVHASVNVYNYSNSTEKPITSLETLTKPLQPWGTENLLGYIDTSGLNVGVYDAKITVYFANLSNDYDVKINFTLAPKPVEPKKKIDLFSTRNLIIALSIALVLVLIITIYVFIPKKKRDSKDRQDNQPKQ